MIPEIARQRHFPPSNTVLLGSMGMLDPDAGDVVQHRIRRAHAKSDVEKNVARRHLRAKPALLVDDDSNALVARPRQT